VKIRILWLFLSCLMVLTLVAWSCGGITPIDGEQEEEEEEEEEEGIAPETTGVAPIQTASGDLVIEVNENGLSINKNRFDMDSTLDDYIRVLGNPSRVTELMNTIHTYDDAGIRLYHPPNSNEINSVSIDFTRGDNEFSPKHAFSGNLVIGGSNIQSSSSLDSLKSINALTVDDSSFGVHRGYLGDTILIFEYMESTDKLDVLSISFSESSKESTITTGPTPLEDGWVRLIIEDVGTIDYPFDFLELQSADYQTLVEEVLGSLRITIPASDFKLQQVGLNDMLPSAFDEYRRVIFMTSYLESGEEVFSAHEEYSLNTVELDVLHNDLLEQLERGYAALSSTEYNLKLIRSISLEVEAPL